MKLELARSTDCFEFSKAVEEHLNKKDIDSDECFAFCFSSILKERVVLSRRRKKINGFSIVRSFIRPDGITLELYMLHGNEETQKKLIEDFRNYAKSYGCKNIVLSHNNIVERI